MSAPTLIVIDVQQDYFGGAHPLPGADAAGERVAGLLARFRASGATVIHVRHEGPAEEGGFLVAGTPGTDPHPSAAERSGEVIVTKQHPNAFVDTDLAGLLPADSALVVVGMMSNMCVDATVRAAIDLGHDVTVAHDACAASDVVFDGTAVPAATVHAAFMGALEDAGATVVPAAAIQSM